ncbi:MAG: glycosyltransferase [Planctomycetota bacterium]
MSSAEPSRTLLCSGSLEGGGSERQLWQLACSLDQALFDPQVYLLYRRGTYLERLPEGMPVHDYWSQAKFGFSLPGQIHRRQVRHLEQTIRKQGIQLVYDRTYHMTLVCAPACWKAEVPRVSVIVSPPSRDFEHGNERFKFLKKKLLRKAYSDPNANTIAVSEEVADDACEYFGISREQIHVFPNPVDIRQVQRQAEVQEAPSASARPGFNCCVVGRMSQEKGQDIAIQAFASALDLARAKDQDVRMSLNLVGSGPDRDTLRARAEELQVAEHVHFHGFLENPYPIIAASDLLILPSVYEGLPNVVLEAMALETPVLATPCSGTLQRILNGANHDFGKIGMQVESRSTQEIADAICQLQTNPEMRFQFAASALKFVEAEHGLEAWLSRMQDVFAARISCGGQAP